MKKMPLLIAVFFACDLALALLYLANWGLHQPFWKLTVLLDLDGEANLPAWYSSMQLFLVAGLMAIFAYLKFDSKRKVSWNLMLWPLVFTGLSLDETAKIHEWLGGKLDLLLPSGTRENTVFWYTGIWMFLLGIPLFLFLLGLIYGLKKYLRGRPGVITKLFVALIIYIGSAAGLEAISNFIPKEGTAHVVEVFFEELGEMIGATFFLWAAYDLLRAHGFSLRAPASKLAEWETTE